MRVCVCGFRLWMAGVPAATSWPELGPGSQAEGRGTAEAVPEWTVGTAGAQGPVPVALGPVSPKGEDQGWPSCPPPAFAPRRTREPDRAPGWPPPAHALAKPLCPGQGCAHPGALLSPPPSSTPHCRAEPYTWVLCTPHLFSNFPSCLGGRPPRPPGPHLGKVSARASASLTGRPPGSCHKGTPLSAVLSHSARGSASPAWLWAPGPCPGTTAPSSQALPVLPPLGCEPDSPRACPGEGQTLGGTPSHLLSE